MPYCKSQYIVLKYITIDKNLLFVWGDRVKINGFQKMTLLDFPGHVAATVFTGGCNLRCPFCHNAALVTEIDPDTLYNIDDVLSFLSSRVGLLDGVAITGGEPLLQFDIAGFIKKIKAMGYKVKLDTNGSYPDKLSEIIEEKLVDYIAVDIKNSKEKYSQTVGIENFDTDKIERTAELLKNGGIDYEFRTTVVKEFHTVEDIKKIGEWVGGAPRYFLQNFVDSGNLIGENMSAVSKETLIEMKKTAEPYFKSVEIRGI